jgi:hypothetical protein
MELDGNMILQAKSIKIEMFLFFRVFQTNKTFSTPDVGLRKVRQAFGWGLDKEQLQLNIGSLKPAVSQNGAWGIEKLLEICLKIYIFLFKNFLETNIVIRRRLTKNLKKLFKRSEDDHINREREIERNGQTDREQCVRDKERTV